MFTNISFILASSSDSRFKILKQNGLNFKKTKPACDEDLIFRKLEKLKKTPTQIVKQLAKEKAKSINSKHPKKLTVGCDTIILFNNNIVKKAKNLTAAKQKILKLSGRKHYIISAISVYKNKKEIWGFVQKNKS